MAEYIPLEEDEQKAFVDWLRIKGIPHEHIPNEVGGSSRGMKLRAMKMKRLGTCKGFPDLLVFVPIKGIGGKVDCYEMLGIEMKRKKGGRVSDEQKEWLKILEMAGVKSKVCKGCDEAIEFVSEYL